MCRQEKYLRYKRLKKQIKAARTSREQYLEAFAQVKGTHGRTRVTLAQLSHFCCQLIMADITGCEADVLLSVEHMQEDHKFYRLLVRVHPSCVVCVRCVRRVCAVCVCGADDGQDTRASHSRGRAHRKMIWT